MIKILSFFDVEWGAEVKWEVWSVANSVPKSMEWRVSGRVECLVPLWKDVQAFKGKDIDEEEFVGRYRKLMVKRWVSVKRWLDGLGDEDVMLCCWERTGFCHRYLVAKLIRKYRPELEVRVS